jgi:hypothetical protein
VGTAGLRRPLRQDCLARPAIAQALRVSRKEGTARAPADCPSPPASGRAASAPDHFVHDGQIKTGQDSERQRTISDDLRNLDIPSKSKPAKTASNPRRAWWGARNHETENFARPGSPCQPGRERAQPLAVGVVGFGHWPTCPTEGGLRDAG